MLVDDKYRRVKAFRPTFGYRVMRGLVDWYEPSSGRVSVPDAGERKRARVEVRERLGLRE